MLNSLQKKKAEMQETLGTVQEHIKVLTATLTDRRGLEQRLIGGISAVEELLATPAPEEEVSNEIPS